MEVAAQRRHAELVGGSSVRRRLARRGKPGPTFSKAFSNGLDFKALIVHAIKSRNIPTPKRVELARGNCRIINTHQPLRIIDGRLSRKPRKIMIGAKPKRTHTTKASKLGRRKHPQRACKVGAKAKALNARKLMTRGEPRRRAAESKTKAYNSHLNSPLSNLHGAKRKLTLTRRPSSAG